VRGWEVIGDCLPSDDLDSMDIDVEDWSLMEVVEMVHHIIIMDVNAKRVSRQAINVDDVVIDEQSWTR